MGCFGVGVKFGPALGQAAAAHAFGDDVETGMHVFESGNVVPLVMDDNLLAYRQEGYTKHNSANPSGVKVS